jgi:two-component system cell cycle response regulator DivK
MPVTSKGKKRVLVIDDAENVRSLFVKTLEPKGFDVVTSADPDVGVEGARETEPDLIFISLLFPHSNGLKVSKAIHADEGLKNVPIVMLITYRGELDPKYTSTIGVVDVLVKPLGAKDILEKTVSLLGGDVPLPDTEKEASVIPSGETEEIYSLEEEFGDLEREDAGLKGESPWDREFTELGSEEAFPGPGDEAATQTPAGEPGVAETPFPADEPAQGVMDDFLDYEREVETTGKEEDIPSGKDDAKDEMKRRFTGDDVIDEEGTFPQPKKNLLKKALIVAGVIVIIAGVTVGVLRLVSFYSGESGSRVEKEMVKDNLPKAAKPDQTASVPEVGRNEESESSEAVPAETKEENLPAADAQKAGTAQSAIPERKAAKTPVTGKRKPQAKQEKTSLTYSVQVGYFKEGKHASRLLESMKKKGYDAYLYTGSDEGKRVLIGKFRDRKQAREQSRRILKDEGLKSVVYQY